MNRNFKFSKVDDWETPIEYFKVINPYIPDDLIINDPFYMNGKAKIKWKELGRDIIHDNTNFFDTIKNDKREIYVSSPPYSNFQYVLLHLFYLDKPFIMLIPIQKIANIKVQKVLRDKKNIQLIVSPIYKGFINIKGEKTRCPPQYLSYLCYKLNLDKDFMIIDQ